MTQNRPQTDFMANLEKLHGTSLSGGSVPAPVAKETSLEDRIAHLPIPAQEAIKELSQLQHSYPIRCYLFDTEEYNSAAIFTPDSWREEFPEARERASKIFFGPYHAEICQVFSKELWAEGRKYGKVIDMGVTG